MDKNAKWADVEYIRMQKWAVEWIRMQKWDVELIRMQ